MMFGKSIQPTLVATVAGVLSGFVAWELFGQEQETIAPVIPLTYDAIQQNDGGTERRLTFARRGDGSEVQITHIRDENGELTELRRIVDLERRALIVVSPSQRTTTTFPYTPQNAGGVRSDQGALCRFLELNRAEASERLGYDVLKHVVESPPGGSSARLELFVAPELGCVALERRHVQLENGQENVLSSERVISVRLGEPNPALFGVPSDYTEASPAEYAWKVAENAGQLPPTSTPFSEQFELTYREMHRNAALAD